jgi:hypothetical protein
MTDHDAQPLTVQASPSPVNQYIRHDGTDAGAAFRAGLDITGICIVGIALILTIYYITLKLMSGMFKPSQVPEDV